MPIPQIEISVYQGPGSNNSRESPSGSSTAKDYIEIPEPTITALLSGDSFVINYIFRLIANFLNTESSLIESLFHVKSDDNESTGRRAGSEKKRRVKMTDLRTFVESRMFSKSDRALERVGIDNVKQLEHVVFHIRSNIFKILDNIFIIIFYLGLSS